MTTRKKKIKKLRAEGKKKEDFYPWKTTKNIIVGGTNVKNKKVK